MPISSNRNSQGQHSPFEKTGLPPFQRERLEYIHARTFSRRIVHDSTPDSKPLISFASITGLELDTPLIQGFPLIETVLLEIMLMRNAWLGGSLQIEVPDLDEFVFADIGTVDAALKRLVRHG